MYRIALLTAFLALALLPGMARAASVRVDRRADFGQEIKGFRFRIDAAAGRAQVEVDYAKFVDTGFDQVVTIGDKTLVFDAEGLSFDPQSMTVVFTDPETGRRVPCSTVAERRSFPNRRFWVFNATGKCRVYGERVAGPGNGGPEIPATYLFDTYLEATE